MAALDHGLGESELLIELKRSALNRQRARCGTGGRELVDDSDAHAESVSHRANTKPVGPAPTMSTSA